MKHKILVVEDENEIRESLKRILELSDYGYLDAENGLIGLQLARLYHPDLIISDIMMPEMDGFELLNELQMDNETSSIPFLFLTAKTHQKDIREGMKLGADDFISKPFDIDELLKAIEVRLDKKKKREKHLNQKIESLQTNITKTLPHEIRTPLNLILGFSEYLLKNLNQLESDETVEMIQNIYDSGKRLQRIFDNFLMMSNLNVILKSESERERLCNNVIYQIELYIEELVQSNLSFQGRIDDFHFDLLPGNIFISEDLFKKVFDEVIDNAVKFSQKGTPINISGFYEGKYYWIIITDYGRGMSSEQIQQMDAYIQFERKIYEQQGAGLGIAIVKKIMEIFKGKMVINSEIKKYTSVSLGFLFTNVF